MARQPRFVLPGQPQHVIQRGNNRQAIFSDAADRRRYLVMLEEALQLCESRLHAYVLMSNHVHLLITPDTATAISQTMQSLGRRYVGYFNHRHGRTGTLWEGRYRATLVDSERYLLTCSRYIELNPVRAGLVKSPEDYPWSSYRHNALGQVDPLLSAHPLYQALGDVELPPWRAYRGLFADALDTGAIEAVRRHTNKGCVLGGEPFKQRVQQALNRQVSPRPRGGDRRSAKSRSRRENNRV
jgi:putative transposase